jgi:colicin import membrane protein
VQFKPDASLAAEPVIIENAAASLGPAIAESATRALLRCQPFTMLKPEHYDWWKSIDMKFSNDLVGG